MIAEVEYPVQEAERTLPAVVTSAPRYSLPQRIRSGYHAFWYWLSEGLEWSRGLYRERPVGQLTHLSGSQQARIAVLRRQFDVRFEQHCAALTTLKSYDYLDILDQAWAAWGQPRPVGGVVHDVGSSNFWYARALHAFFLPSALTGIEVEGHRIYYNGYSRHDYAQGYVHNLPQAEFVIADLTHERPNVYLEVGYAWGRKVPTVLVTREADDLKFDVKGQRCIARRSIRASSITLSRPSWPGCFLANCSATSKSEKATWPIS